MQVEREYQGLSGFVGSSWELYRPELEAVTFPVFVHCYLTLVMFDHGDEVRGRGPWIERSWHVAVTVIDRAAQVAYITSDVRGGFTPEVGTI